jgi:hypothetical protein
MIHDFHERLRFSEACSDEPFWEAVYREAFPNLVSHMLCSGDTTSQRMGIDRLLMLGSGQELRIDEKKRGREYGDFLLEYLSNDHTGAPGWIEKDLFIDYLAYAFMPSQKVYLLPWQMLRRAWMIHGETWKQRGEDQEPGYRIVSASNPGYRTWSVAVPINVLYRSMNSASVIEVELAKRRTGNAQPALLTV